MGNCASVVNCTLTSQPIESDPDVAGIGVLVAFSATVIITFIAVIIGYLTDSLPDSTLTELDRAREQTFSMRLSLPDASDSDGEDTDTRLFALKAPS